MMRRHVFAVLAGLVSMLAATGSAHAQLLFDQNITPNVIFGTGNSNGGFTVDRNAGAGVELGLRAKTRFPSPSDSPAGIMSQGNGTYGNFAAQGYNSDGTTGGPRASWSFDWTINTNYNGFGGNLSGLTYSLDIDYDPTAGTNFLSFDPVALISDNATSGGIIAQNSGQLNFFPGSPAFNPNVSGIYDVALRAFRESDSGTEEVAATRIRVLVGDAVAPVPEPGSLAIWSLLGLAGAVRRWRRKA